MAMGFAVIPCCLAGFDLPGSKMPGPDLPGLTPAFLTFTGLALAGASLVEAAMLAVLAGLGLTIVLAGTTMALLARFG